MLKCIFLPEFIDKEWSTEYQMEANPLIAYAMSMGPNGKDIWLSGGIFIDLIDSENAHVVSTINVIRGETLTVTNGPDLPKPLAGHCQLHIDNDQLFIFGGITSITINGTYRNYQVEGFHYSNKAYLWSKGNWLQIPEENPCSNDGQDLAFQQPCTTRVKSDEIEVVIVTFSQRKACTSVLNLNTLQWSMIDISKVTIPIGGHLVTSLDKSRVFYLGGIYYDHEISMQSLDMYELGANGWELKDVKLPFGVGSNETYSYASLHNVTLN